MAEIRSFRDLNVYQKTKEAAHTIFKLTKSFPKEERYALTDQVRRSSSAVPLFSILHPPSSLRLLQPLQ